MRRLSFLLTLMLVGACDSQTPPMKMDEPLRPFQATALDGKRYEFPRDSNGRVTVLRFWADWCVYCRTELSDAEEVWGADGDRGILILAVNAGQKRDAVAAFTAELNLSYPVLLDEESKVTRQYGVTGLPTTFIVDRNGLLKAKILGATDKATFKKIVEELL